MAVPPVQGTVVGKPVVAGLEENVHEAPPITRADSPTVPPAALTAPTEGAKELTVGGVPPAPAGVPAAVIAGPAKRATRAILVLATRESGLPDRAGGFQIIVEPNMATAPFYGSMEIGWPATGGANLTHPP
jgi:hypothetical protein